MTDTNKWSEAYDELEHTTSLLAGLVDRVKTSQRKITRFRLEKDSKVLDLCCGVGRFIVLFQKLGYFHVFGLDISLSLIQKIPAEVRGRVIVSDAMSIGFAGSSFDTVFVNGALHHFDATQWELVIGEVHRILRSKGSFCFIEPRNTKFRQLCHLVIFSPLGKLFRSLRIIRTIWTEEKPTYFSWLEGSELFLRLLRNSFDITVCEQDHMYIYVSAKKRGNGSGNE